MKIFNYILFLILNTGILLAQEPASVISTTRSIADKIIKETLFEYQMVPLDFNGGITQFNINQYVEEAGANVWYAYGIMVSEKDAEGILGLSFNGQIKIFLNGKDIFTGKSENVGLFEYTYNRYRFDNQIPVHWKAGNNEILVKCIPGSENLKVLMMALNDIDEKELFVNIKEYSKERSITPWLTCGPWKSKSEDAINMEFQPEKGIEDYYSSENGFMKWEMNPTPLIRELIISDSNSYTRDHYGDWHYANGGTMLGILSLGEVTKDHKYSNFVKEFADNIIENEEYFRWQYFTNHTMRGSFHRIYRMTMLDDSGGPAIPLAELQTLNPESNYLPLLNEVLDYVRNKQERLIDFTLSRPEPEAATVWADDLFMSVPFLLRMAEINNNDELYSEVCHQIINFNKYLVNPETGLYFHAWYNNRQENSPIQWARANGWVIWAASEALLHVPESHADYKTVLGIYRDHMKALVQYQGESGMWHQVLDHPESFQETSSTAMYVLSMARGVRMEWLEKKYSKTALKGWIALQDKIEEDGTVKDICRGTGIGNDVAFYNERQRFDHDPRGLGAVLTAGCEISLLLESEMKHLQ